MINLMAVHREVGWRVTGNEMPVCKMTNLFRFYAVASLRILDEA